METKHHQKIAVIGLFDDRITLGNAIEGLRANGFRNSDLSALLPDASSTMEVAHEKHTKAPEGAATGAVAGGVTAGVLGWVVGIGTLAIPGVGPLIAAGPIMAALGGVAAGGAVGGLAGALVGFGIPEYEAKQYEGKIKNGNIMISVHTDDSRQRKIAKEIFDRDHATDVSSTGEARV